MPDKEDVASELRRAVTRLTWLTVVLFVCLSVLAATVFALRSADLSRIGEDAERNRIALCTLREDLRKRVVNSQQFLDEHPGGIPGISPEDIRENIENQRRTIEALSIVKCNARDNQ